MTPRAEIPGARDDTGATGAPGAAGPAGATGGGDGRPARLGRGFGWLLAGETVSQLGTMITTIAVPAIAVFRLGAGPAEVGLLAAATRLPFPFLGLVAGVVADRLSRRTVMVVCDVARVITLAAIPIADVTGHMSVALLFAVALLSGSFGVFFDICNLAVVPALVGRRGLVRAYSWLEVTSAVSALVGPGLGGLLVQVMGAARAVAADAASYLVSAVCILVALPRARALPSTVVAPPGAGPSPLADVREGLRFVVREPVLRSMLLSQGVLILGAHSIEAPLVLFAYTTLGLSPGTLGLLLSVAGAGALVGAALARRSARWRPGRTLVVLGLVTGTSICLIPLAAVAPLVVLPAILVVETCSGTLGNVTQIVLRQSRTPERMQGRMNAVFRVVYWGVWPVGSILGGLLASVTGPAPALVVGGAVSILSSAVAYLTPLRHATREMTAAPEPARAR